MLKQQVCLCTFSVVTWPCAWAKGEGLRKGLWKRDARSHLGRGVSCAKAEPFGEM